jgi:hypothetical protein
MAMGRHRVFILGTACGLLAMLSCAPPAARAAEETSLLALAEATIEVGPEQWGVSTRYIGGTEGDSRFEIEELRDCGINTLRIYGDMSRFEPTDDDGEYGAPTIAQIKADPDVIAWERWDEVMDGPYSPHIEGAEGQPPLSWRRVFAELKEAGIRPVIALRNRDTHLQPEWSPAVPETAADWNEWWEYVFAMAYWLNVRNDYRVDEFEVLNEPNVRTGQGWTGTRQQYFEMVTKTKDALDCVYRTYLPGRTFHLHAPVTAGGRWVPSTLREVGPYFDSLNVHSYARDLEGFVRTMHGHLTESGYGDRPIWLSEWATYTEHYEDIGLALRVVANMIRCSRPGTDYVYGSHIFSFYDWVYAEGPQWGLVTGDGTRHATYYAFRLAIRALQGAKPTFRATTGADDLMAIATKEADGRVNLLVLNWNELVSYHITADLSGLLSDGTGEIRHFSATVRDEAVGKTDLTDGASEFGIPPYSVVLVTYKAGG